MAMAAVVLGNFESSVLCRHHNGTSNYRTWKEQMLCLIESQGLLAFIHGEPPQQQVDGQQQHAEWRQNDRLVKGWILRALSDSVAETVVDCDSARDVWVRLENDFAPPPADVAMPEPDWNQYLDLYRSALDGNWPGIIQFVATHNLVLSEALTQPVARTFETPLHVAVGGGNPDGFVQTLVNAITDVQSLDVRDAQGFNALHVAAWTGNLAAAQLLVAKNANLLYSRSNDGRFPVHLAADSGHRETLDYLMLQTGPGPNGAPNPFAGASGFMLLIYLMDADYFDVAANLVNNHPDLARYWSTRGHKSALRVIALRASLFSDSLTDVKGKQLDQTMRNHAQQLLDKLCLEMRSMTDKEAANIYREAMLVAARVGNAAVIKAIAHNFPTAVFTCDASTKQNFLHVAVRNRCETVYNLIYQTTDHRHHYANMIDSSGNSIHHLAAMLAPPHSLNLVNGAALQMQRDIQWFDEVEKYISPRNKSRTNKDKKTPDMVFSEQHRELRAEGEKWMKDTATSCSITAALIVTIVFAAAITVPGGNNSSGYPYFFFSKKPAFITFAVSNVISLFASTNSLLIFLSILTSRFAERDFLWKLPVKLYLGLFTLFIAIVFMTTAYGSTVFLVLANHRIWVLIPVTVLAFITILVFSLLQGPLIWSVLYRTHCGSIFGKMSDRRFP